MNEEAEGALLLQGTFSKPMGHAVTASSLLLPDSRYIYGTLLEGNSALRSIKIGPSWTMDVQVEEIPGKTFAYFGAYSPFDLHLVIDPEIVWSRITFEPQPALATRVIGTDGQFYRQTREWSENRPVPEGSALIPAGWDHEHCKFCFTRIGEGDIGYRSTGEDYGNEWACEWCYEHAISPHDPSPLLTDYKSRI